jgi:hypothetical protein
MLLVEGEKLLPRLAPALLDAATASNIASRLTQSAVHELGEGRSRRLEAGVG